MTRDQAYTHLTRFIQPHSYRSAGSRAVVAASALAAGTPLEAFYRWIMYVAVQGIVTRVAPPITQWNVVGTPWCSQPFDPQHCLIHMRLSVAGAHLLLTPSMTPRPTSALLFIQFEVKAARQRSAVRAELHQDGRGTVFEIASLLSGNGINTFRVDNAAVVTAAAP